MTDDLPTHIAEKVEDLSEEGSTLFDDDKFEAAIAKWTAALELLPEPKRDWEAWTWLCTSIGDAWYSLERYETASERLFDALNGPGAVDNAFIHYRLGQCLYRLGRVDAAIQSLLKAYMLDGETIFLEGEEDGPFWLSLLRDRKLAQ